MNGYSLVELVPVQEFEWDEEVVVDENIDEDVLAELDKGQSFDYIAVKEEIDEHTLIELGLENDEFAELEA